MTDGADRSKRKRSAPERTRPRPTATQQALGLLVRREHSRKELARKLMARGVEPDDAGAAVERLADAGWQDDVRFAQSLLRSRAAAGYGPVRIRMELATHGIDTVSVEHVFAACDCDWPALAHNILTRRFPEGERRESRMRRKMIDLLLRRGFDTSIAFAVVDGSCGDE